MSAFEKIKLGLEQAIEYEKGNLKARSRKLSIEPVTRFEAKEIRDIRLMTGLTQAAFASYIGVSVKTVEAWEAGRNHPDGAACRLLSITRANPSFPLTSGIIVQ